MKKAIMVITLLGVADIQPVYSGMKRVTNAITQDSVNLVQGELNRDFGQLLDMLDQGKRQKMIENEQEWQKSLDVKVAASPEKTLDITFQEMSARVCVIERIIEQLMAKGSSK